MKAALIATALVAASGSAFGGSLVIAEFTLSDHPDGNQSPPPYGLRVDHIIAPGTATLSLDYFANTTLSVIDTDGDLSINISGTLFGGAVSQGLYVDGGEAYEIDMTYSIGVDTMSGGYVVNGFDAANSGALTRVSDNTVFDLYTTDMDGVVFKLLPDGHRLSGDNETWVGRGWVTDEVDGSDPHGGRRDWLFIATETEVPAPAGAIALAGAGLVLARRRR